MLRFLKIGGIVIGALVLTTLGISASDTLNGASGSLVSMVFQSQKITGCAAGSSLVVSQGRQICVDIFEESTAESCPVLEPKNLQETEKNLGVRTCTPVSQKGRVPWRFVNLSQAQRACAAAGKRLMTNEEWYRAALGTPTDEKTCFSNDPGAQGPRIIEESDCRSGSGMFDMVGNVWEWVDVSVDNGRYNDRELPSTGYISGVDADGVALGTGETADMLYGKDYFWQTKEGVRGMLRGGFYGSGEDGGIYAINGSVDLAFGSNGVGFRCARDYAP